MHTSQKALLVKSYTPKTGHSFQSKSIKGTEM